MYVGMTRAEETLRLMKIPVKPNPFLKEIRGDYTVSKTFTGAATENDLQNLRYELIGLNEVYMDYAGCFHKGQSIHNQLSCLETGQRVVFHLNETGIEIHNTEGFCVAKLSKEGVLKWSKRLDRICELRVIALLKRDRDDPKDEFQDRIKVDQWELPVLEAVYLPS
jgi:ATP-dependent DNA helicase RecQ